MMFDCIYSPFLAFYKGIVALGTFSSVKFYINGGLLLINVSVKFHFSAGSLGMGNLFKSLPSKIMLEWSNLEAFTDVVSGHELNVLSLSQS